MQKKFIEQMILLAKTELDSSISKAVALQGHMEKIYARNLECAGLTECKKSFDEWSVLARKSSANFQVVFNEGLDRIGNFFYVKCDQNSSQS